MIAHPIIHLLKHLLQELGRVLASDVDDLVHETGLHELVAGDALAHDERLVGLADAESAYEADGGVALGHETERGEGRQEEGVGSGVDEVGKSDEGGAEADGGAVHGTDEDLGVGV